MTAALETFQNANAGTDGALSHLRTIGVYRITCNPNGMVYIGSSTDVSHRTSGHLSKLRSGKHSNKGMLDDFIRFGEANFTLALVERHPNIRSAQLAERRLILASRKLGLSYNSVVVGSYRSRHDGTPAAASEGAAMLQEWMENNDKTLADLRALLGRDRIRIFRIMTGAIPNPEEMRRIFDWTKGEVDANAFYGFPRCPEMSQRLVA